MIVVVSLSLKQTEIWTFKQGLGLLPQSFTLDTQDILISKNLDFYLKKLKKKNTIKAISFRVLFGGDYFKKPCLVDKNFYQKFRKLLSLYPFYVPLAEKVIKSFRASIAKVPFFVFFETSFFSNLPQEAKRYSLPYKYSSNSNIRRWGFGGIYHEFNAKEVLSGAKVISIVLDRQTTISSVYKNKPLSTSLGYTPLEGVMGKTSCGDLDPGIIFYLMKKYKFSIHQIDDVLKNQSGFLGVSGYDLDLFQLYKLYGKDSNVTLSFDIYKTQIFKYIGEGISMLGGLDCIVVSGPHLSALLPIVYAILKTIYFLGLSLKNLPWPNNENVSEISNKDSKIKAYLNHTPLEEIIYYNTKKYLA